MESTVMEAKMGSLIMKVLYKGIGLFMTGGFGDKINYINPDYEDKELKDADKTGI